MDIDMNHLSPHFHDVDESIHPSLLPSQLQAAGHALGSIAHAHSPDVEPRNILDGTAVNTHGAVGRLCFIEKRGENKKNLAPKI